MGVVVQNTWWHVIMTNGEHVLYIPRFLDPLLIISAEVCVKNLRYDSIVKH